MKQQWGTPLMGNERHIVEDSMDYKKHNDFGDRMSEGFREVMRMR